LTEKEGVFWKTILDQNEETCLMFAENKISAISTHRFCFIWVWGYGV
jgi:hypothetical protein